ncbi:glycosyltransferase [Symbiobacterium thermophilum]|uniref:glycosyltransferase n=1 Tax=Symbiobacterium thermophilum TaxID=2734 RepID=UPI0035C771EF
MTQRKNPRLLVLACDGLDPDVILHNLHRLPFIRSLCQGGGHGVVESAVHSCDIWTTHYTGLPPEQHGVQFSRLALAKQPADLSAVKTDLFLWDWLNRHGLTVGFVEPLHAYPAPQVKGFFVSGSPRPSLAQTDRAVWPPALKPLIDREYMASLPKPPSLKDLGVDKPFNELTDAELLKLLDGYFADAPALLRPHLNWYLDLVERLWTKVPCDVLWVYFMETDVLGHFLFNDDPPEALVQVYAEMDRGFARLAQRTGAEAVLLLSDHGMTPIARLLTQPQSTPLMRNLAEEYRVAGTRLLRPNLAVVQGYNQGLCTGTHRDRAFYAVRSPRVRSGVRADVHFHDLFGLLLRVLGLPVPPGRRAYRGPLFPEPAPAPGPARAPTPGPGTAPRAATAPGTTPTVTTKGVRPLRIGILTYGIHKGGRGRTVARLAEGLARRGHDTFILMLEGQPVAYPVRVPIHRMPAFEPHKFPQADVIIPASLGLIPKALGRSSHVTVPLHFRFEPDVAYDARTALHVVSLPYRSMATAAPVAARVQQQSGRPCHPVPPGIDTAIFKPGARPPGGPRRVGFIYRSPALGYGFKGADCFFTAMQRVLHEERDVRVCLLNPDGLPVDAPIPVEVVEARSDEEIARFYRSLDVFVTASVSDGAQLGVLEAMACGTPVVATDAGGIREYATPGINCFMGLPNHPKMLGDLVLAALRDRNRARGFANAALQMVRTRTWDAFVDAAEAAVQAACAERRREAKP